MVPLPPETQYVLGVLVAAALTFAVATRVFLPDVAPVALVREFRRTDWRYVGLGGVVTLACTVVADSLHVDWSFTALVYRLEGPTVAAFQSVTTVVPEWAAYALTGLCTAAYLVGFPFVVLFTYFKLKAHDETQARRYAMAYCALVALAVPLFLLFPVDVPGLYLLDVRPLMLDFNPIVRAGATATDILAGTFPSLPTGLSVLAALYARNTTDGYARVVGVLAGAVVLSTLYLGVHWLTDAAVAVGLAVVVYWASQRVDAERLDRLDPVARAG